MTVGFPTLENIAERLERCERIAQRLITHAQDGHARGEQSEATTATPALPQSENNASGSGHVSNAIVPYQARTPEVAQLPTSVAAGAARGAAGEPSSSTTNILDGIYLQGTGASPTLVEAVRTTVQNTEDSTERVQRARQQITGAHQAHALLAGAIQNGTSSQSEFRTLLQSQADTLYHILTQSLGEEPGLATIERSRQIHEATGSLGLLGHYVGAGGATPEAARTLLQTHATELQRLAPLLRSEMPADADIAALHRLLGSDNDRLQRTPHEFGYDLVARFRSRGNATEPLSTAAPLVGTGVHESDSESQFSEEFAHRGITEIMSEAMVPGLQFIYESTAANITNNLAAIARGDTATLQADLLRSRRFLERIRRPFDVTLGHQEVRSNLLEHLMLQAPQERNATLVRIEAEAAQARELQERLNRALRGLPLEALNRLSNTLN